MLYNVCVRNGRPSPQCIRIIVTIDDQRCCCLPVSSNVRTISDNKVNITKKCSNSRS